MEGPAPVCCLFQVRWRFHGHAVFARSERNIARKTHRGRGTLGRPDDAEWLKSTAGLQSSVFGTAEDRILQILDRQLWSSFPERAKALESNRSIRRLEGSTTRSSTAIFVTGQALKSLAVAVGDVRLRRGESTARQAQVTSRYGTRDGIP